MVRWKPIYLSNHYYRILFAEKCVLEHQHKNYFLEKPRLSRKRQPILYNKSLTITARILDKYVYIYKGKLLRELQIPQFSVGLKIGEFSMTRKPFHFTQKVKKKK